MENMEQLNKPLEEEEKAQSILSMKKMDDFNALTQNENKIPLTVVDALPSNFIGYPKGTQISYAALTLQELEALNPSDDKPVDLTEGIAMLLNAIHCNTMKSQDLYYWDVMYIGIKRKLLAFGNTMGTIYGKCPKCGKIVKKQFKYTDIDFKQLHIPALPMRMKINDVDVQCEPLTMKDFLQIDVDQGAMGAYARMIKNLPFEEAYNLVTNAYGLNIKKILYMDKQLDYGMKPFMVNCGGTINVPNPNFDINLPEDTTNRRTLTKKCDEQVAVEVTSPFEVVFPEDTNNGDIEFEVQYG